MRVPFTLVSRVILIQGGKYLLCRVQGYDYWFLPGGGVEDREDALECLRREMREETGLEIHDVTFVAAVQNFFEHRNAFENEVNLVFKGQISEDAKVTSLEEHIEVGMFSVEEIEEMKIVPVSLKLALLKHARGEEIPTFIGYEGERCSG